MGLQHVRQATLQTLKTRTPTRAKCCLNYITHSTPATVTPPRLNHESRQIYNAHINPCRCHLSLPGSPAKAFRPLLGGWRGDRRLCPTSQPNQPAQPASQPANQPASQPASQPTSQPAKQPSSIKQDEMVDYTFPNSDFIQMLV